MARRIALLFLVVTTFMTALIGNAFAKEEPIRLGNLLDSSPSETFEIPPHLGGGFRECYLVRASFKSVLHKVRQELTPRGWKEIVVKNAPAHTLFMNGTREVQILQGRAQGATALHSAGSRLAARSLSWEPVQDWVSVIFDSPSTHPLDRTLGVLHDLRDALPGTVSYTDASV